jgi:hypothetical protein
MNDKTGDTSVLDGVLETLFFEYDYRLKRVTLYRYPYSEDARVEKVNDALGRGTVNMDDLRTYVHEQLVTQGKFEGDKRKKDIAIPTKLTDTLVSYAATWGAVPWSMHTSDTDVGQALRLLDVIIRDLTTPFVPRELRRDFCC